MTGDLIVDFPRYLKLRRVHFAESSQLHIYERHNVARQELWYTKAEYELMALVRRKDVLQVRAAAASSSREPVDDDISTKESVCLMGIEHLLTSACIKEVRACRARCTRAVLTKQARQGQGPSSDLELGWEAIALASLAQTRKATLRARQLGVLHRDQESL